MLSELIVLLINVNLLLGSKNTAKQQIDAILMLFNSSYEQLEGESLRHLMVSITAMCLI